MNDQLVSALEVLDKRLAEDPRAYAIRLMVLLEQVLIMRTGMALISAIGTIDQAHAVIKSMTEQVDACTYEAYEALVSKGRLQ